MGDKSSYDPAVHPFQAQMLCERGAVDREIAEFFGISTITFYKWRNSHPEFADAMTVAKEAADVRVERSLYNRAVGYSYDSEKLVTVANGGNNGSTVERHAIVEHVPPDPKAAIRWLEARKPDVWRRQIAHAGPDGGPIPHSVEDSDFSGLSQDERDKLRSLLAKAVRDPDQGPGAG